MKLAIVLCLLACSTLAECLREEASTHAGLSHRASLGKPLRGGRRVLPSANDLPDWTSRIRQSAEYRAPPTTYSPVDPRGKVGRIVVLSSLAVILALILAWAWFSKGQRASADEAIEERQNKNIPQDAYGLAVASMIRDFTVISKGEGSFSLRCLRIAAAILLITLNIAIQVLLMVQIQKFVTSKWVHDIRVDYGQYELHMYGDEPGHTTLTVNGKHRGVPGYFVPENFDTLPIDLKDRVCNIPFSEPVFFLSILLIWTLTCMMEIRQCVSFFQSLIVSTPTIQDMAHCLVEQDADEDAKPPEPERVIQAGVFTKVRQKMGFMSARSELSEGSQLHTEATMIDEDHEQVLVGLTIYLKIGIMIFIVIPRLVITLVLLWLGSRFLAATNDFSELVLNAVGLEFVLLVKDLLYSTVVPERNKREVDHILLHPSARFEPASYWTYLGTFKWLYIACMWGIYYMYWLQQVLPQYRWDVRGMCSPWLVSHYRA